MKKTPHASAFDRRRVLRAYLTAISLNAALFLVWISVMRMIARKSDVSWLMLINSFVVFFALVLALQSRMRGLALAICAVAFPLVFNVVPIWNLKLAAHSFRSFHELTVFSYGTLFWLGPLVAAVFLARSLQDV